MLLQGWIQWRNDIVMTIRLPSFPFYVQSFILVWKLQYIWENFDIYAFHNFYLMRCFCLIPDADLQINSIYNFFSCLVLSLGWKEDCAVGNDDDILIKMDSARSWFRKFLPRGDKLRSGHTKKKETENRKDGQKAPVDEAPSNITKQKVAAAKEYIENHYKAQMKCIQDRKERWFHPFLIFFFSYDIGIGHAE